MLRSGYKPCLTLLTYYHVVPTGTKLYFMRPRNEKKKTQLHTLVGYSLQGKKRENAGWFLPSWLEGQKRRKFYHYCVEIRGKKILERRLKRWSFMR